MGLRQDMVNRDGVGKTLFATQEKCQNHFGIEETGSVEDTPSSPNTKAKWFTDMGNTVLGWPEVVGVEYSHTLANYRGTPMPYWVDSSDAALNAYREVGADSCFK